LLKFTYNIAIDLGTSTVLVYIPGRGVILREPSVLAIDKRKNKVVAIGEAAQDMVGRTPANIQAVRPVSEGVIADYRATIQLLEHIFYDVCGVKRMFKPNVLISAPSGATDVQRRAARNAVLEAGAGRAETIEAPMAAALGAGLPIESPGGNLVVDIGGGITDIAVLSVDGIVLSRSLPVGGGKLDDAIVRYVRNQYNVSIGDRTAEEIKLTIGSAMPLEREMEYSVRGRDIVTGLPKGVTLKTTEVREAIAEPIAQIALKIKSVLENTPPELSADIMQRGITLTGGAASLRGLTEILALATQVPVRVAEDPVACVAIGVGKAMEQSRGLTERVSSR
jgi:rod shape-determining protein MreB